MAITVKTHSGRVYEIDTEAKRFRTEGEQPFADYVRGGERDPHHDWHDYTSVQVNDLGRLFILESSGEYRHSTRIVEGLDELLTALDG